MVSAVTNAFGDPTRREIYLFVRDAGRAGVTAGEVAERFELHPNVARHHLEKLTGGGYLVVEIAKPAVDGAARAAGRPSKRYLAGPLDATLALPLKHDDLLGGLLARALDALGAEQAEALADEVGFEYGTHARRAHGSDRGPPVGARRARRRRRRAHRARVRRAHRVARRSARHRVGVLPVRRDRAARTRTSCARSTAG